MDRQAVVISAEQAIVAFVRSALEPLGFTLTARQKLSTALKTIKGDELVVLDVPDTARSLKEIRSYHPESLIIVLADRSCQGKAVEEDAYFCMVKPVDEALLQTAARNAARLLALRVELDRVKEIQKDEQSDSVAIKAHIPSQRLQRMVERASGRDVPVLISGEKGTGREFIARAIHLKSARRHGPFIPMELTNGAWTDATFKETLCDIDGGTLFVKDLEKVPPELSELLKGCLCANGHNGHADVRVICGANGKFDDTPLMERFGIVVKLPALHSRTADILPLAREFAAEAIGTFSLEPIEFSKAAREALKRHDWPGNVKELKNTITRACLSARGGVIEPEDLFPAGGETCASVKDFLQAKLGKYLKNVNKLGKASLHDTVVSEVEKSLIELVLGETGGNQLKTAQALGITRTTLRSKIKNYKITQSKGTKKQSRT